MITLVLLQESLLNQLLYVSNFLFKRDSLSNSAQSDSSGWNNLEADQYSKTVPLLNIIVEDDSLQVSFCTKERIQQMEEKILRCNALVNIPCLEQESYLEFFSQATVRFIPCTHIALLKLA